MWQQRVGTCSECSGPIIGNRQFPMTSVQIEPGDSCGGCGAMAVSKFCESCGCASIEMRPQQSAAPGVQTMQDFVEVAARRRC